jgi:hypothetical protein
MIVDSYRFGDFLEINLDSMPLRHQVVHVKNADGAPATKAAFEKRILSDGSVVYDLVLEFSK